MQSVFLPENGKSVSGQFKDQGVGRKAKEHKCLKTNLNITQLYPRI